MTISQMTTEQAADALVRISYAVSPIVKEEKIRQTIEIVAGHREDKDVLATIGDVIDCLVPTLLKDYRTNVYEIVSALAGKSAEEVATQNILVTIRDIKESVDQELIDFFTSSKS